MLDPTKHAKLEAFLAALPERHAARLLAACEAAGQGGDSGLPLDMMRAALLQRVRSPVDLVFGAARPLVRDSGGAKQVGRIARASLDSALELAREIAPRPYSQIIAGVQPLNAHREMIGRALSAALESDSGGKDGLEGRLGARGRADLAELAALLCAEPELSDGLAELPETIADLNERAVRRVGDLFDAVAAKHKAAPVLLLFLITERLEKRAQILRVLKRLVGQEDDLVAAQTDIGAIGDMLLDEAEAGVRAMASASLAAPDGRAIVEAVSRFAAISRGMTRDLGIRREGRWGQRLKTLRKQAAISMDSLCAAAPAAIDAALPQARISLDGGAPALRPDASAPPREAILQTGLDYAIILGGVVDHASSCAFAASYGKAREAAERLVDAYCDGMIQLIQHADDDGLERLKPWHDAAEAFVAALLDARAADVFRRRAAAAAAARAQAKVA